MHAALKWAEFVPAAPLLPLLAEVMGYAVAFGLCVLALKFVSALFQTAEKGIGWIPWLGSKVTGELKVIEQRLTDTLGSWVALMDHKMALSWYKLAHTAEWIAHEIAANAGVLADLANVVWNPLSISAWRKIIGDVQTTIHGVRNSIAGRVHSVTQPITARIARLERWTHARIHMLSHAIDVTIPHDIRRLRARTRALEDGYLRVFHRLKGLENRFATAAFAAAVAVALGRLGLTWARCSGVGRVGRAICGLGPQLVEELLGTAIVSFAVLDICDFAIVSQSVARAFAPELMALVDVEDALIGCHGATAAPLLTLPTLHLPPTNLGLQLAA